MITQKLNFESSLPQILLIRMRASDIAFITNMCKYVAEKYGMAIFSFISTYFNVKKGQKAETHF